MAEKKLKPASRSFRGTTANGYSITATIKTVALDPKKNVSRLSWVLELIIGDKVTFGKAPVIADFYIYGAFRWQFNNKSLKNTARSSKQILASGMVDIKHDQYGEAGVTLSAHFRTVDRGEKTKWKCPPLSLSGTYSVEQLPLQPDQSLKPVITENLSTRVITATVPITPPNYNPVTGYQIQVRDDDLIDEWKVYNCAMPGRTLTILPRKPHTTLRFMSRAKSKSGFGPWSKEESVIKSTGTGPSMKYGGVYRLMDTYVRNGGSWIPVLTYVKSGGIWRIVNH